MRSGRERIRISSEARGPRRMLGWLKFYIMPNKRWAPRKCNPHQNPKSHDCKERQIFIKSCKGKTVIIYYYYLVFLFLLMTQLIVNKQVELESPSQIPASSSKFLLLVDCKPFTPQMVVLGHEHDANVAIENPKTALGKWQDDEDYQAASIAEISSKLTPASNTSSRRRRRHVQSQAASASVLVRALAGRPVRLDCPLSPQFGSSSSKRDSMFESAPVATQIDSLELRHHKAPSVGARESDRIELILWYKQPLGGASSSQSGATWSASLASNLSSLVQQPIYSVDGRETGAAQDASAITPKTIAPNRGGFESGLLELVAGARARHHANTRQSHRIKLDFVSGGDAEWLATLKVARVGLEDAGAYKCRVDFRQARTRTQLIRLQVIEPVSEIEIKIGDKSASEANWTRQAALKPKPSDGILRLGANETLRVACEAKNGWPRARLAWWQFNLASRSGKARGGEIDESISITRLASSEAGRLALNVRDLLAARAQPELPGSFGQWLEWQRRQPDLISNKKPSTSTTNPNLNLNASSNVDWLARYMSEKVLQIVAANKSSSPPLNQVSHSDGGGPRVLLACSAHNLAPSKLRELLTSSNQTTMSAANLSASTIMADSDFDFTSSQDSPGELASASQNDKLAPIPIDFVQVQVEDTPGWLQILRVRRDEHAGLALELPSATGLNINLSPINANMSASIEPPSDSDSHSIMMSLAMDEPLELVCLGLGRWQSANNNNTSNGLDWRLAGAASEGRGPLAYSAKSNELRLDRSQVRESLAKLANISPASELRMDSLRWITLRFGDVIKLNAAHRGLLGERHASFKIECSAPDSGREKSERKMASMTELSINFLAKPILGRPERVAANKIAAANLKTITRTLEHEQEPVAIPTGTQIALQCPIIFANPAPLGSQTVEWLINGNVISANHHHGHQNPSIDVVYVTNSSSSANKTIELAAEISDQLDDGPIIVFSFNAAGLHEFTCRARNELGASASLGALPIQSGLAPRCTRAESRVDTPTLGDSKNNIQSGDASLAWMQLNCPIEKVSMNDGSDKEEKIIHYHWLALRGGAEWSQVLANGSSNSSLELWNLLEFLDQVNRHQSSAGSSNELASSDAHNQQIAEPKRAAVAASNQDENLATFGCFATNKFGSNSHSPCIFKVNLRVSMEFKKRLEMDLTQDQSHSLPQNLSKTPLKSRSDHEEDFRTTNNSTSDGLIISLSGSQNSQKRSSHSLDRFMRTGKQSNEESAKYWSRFWNFTLGLGLCLLATITIITLFWVCNNTHSQHSRSHRKGRGRSSRHYKAASKQTNSGDINSSEGEREREQQQHRMVYIKDFVTQQAIKTTQTGSQLAPESINQQEFNVFESSSSSRDHLELLHYQQQRPQRMQIAPVNSVQILAMQANNQKPSSSSRESQASSNRDSDRNGNASQAFEVRCKCVNRSGASYATASNRLVESSLSQQSLSDVLFIQTPSPMADMLQSNNCNQQHHHRVASGLWTKQAGKLSSSLSLQKQQQNQTSELNSFGEPFGTDETSSVNHDDSFVIITPNGIDNNNHYRQHQAAHLTLVKSPLVSSMESPLGYQSNADKNSTATSIQKPNFYNVDRDDHDDDDDDEDEDDDGDGDDDAEQNCDDKGFYQANYETGQNNQLVGQLFLYNDNDDHLQTTNLNIQPPSDCQGRIIITQNDARIPNNESIIQRRKSGDRVRFLIDDDWS